MASVIVKVLGGDPKEVEAATVGAIKASLGLGSYRATINGESANDEDELQDYDVVNLSSAKVSGL